MNTLNVTDVDNLILLIQCLRRLYSKTYQRIWFDTPILRQPEWQNIQLLPASYVDKLEVVWAHMLKNLESEFENPLHGFKDYEVQRMQRVIDYMREGCKLDPEYVKIQRANFYRFFNEHDKRRGTDFVKTFPEMIDFYKQCEYYAKTT
jgi:hypothetical protein